MGRLQPAPAVGRSIDATLRTHRSWLHNALAALRAEGSSNEQREMLPERKLLDWLCARVAQKSSRNGIGDRPPPAGFPDGQVLDEVLPLLAEAFTTGSPGPAQRPRRRQEGAVCTPADVALYLARGALARYEGEAPRCIDPAVGTGIITRCILDVLAETRGYSRDLARSSLFGWDTSPVAALVARYVVASRLLARGAIGLAGVGKVVTDLEHNFLVGDATLLAAERMKEGTPAFSVLVANPPYSQIPWDSDGPIRLRHFRSAPLGSPAHAYLMFVEMMWHLTDPDHGSGAVVVPLSLAFSSDASHEAARVAIQETLGQWQFEFFDRSPDSLFGDSVKTRSAIVWLKRNNGGKCSISTSDFRRWSSRSREAALQARLEVAEISDVSIRKLIPKLATSSEKQAWLRLTSLSRSTATVSGRRAFQKKATLHRYSTAYNWLPILRTLDPFADSTPPSSVKAVVVPETLTPNAAFAILQSNLTYWWWRVEGDGFHLTDRFINKVLTSCSRLTPASQKSLEELGKGVWEEMQSRPVRAVNAGVQTITFDPNDSQLRLGEVDGILVRELGLPSGFESFLHRHRVETIRAGRHHDEPDESTSDEAVEGRARELSARELSRLSKEDWREYTKTVWSIPNTSDPAHPAVFPPEIPRRLVKLFSLVGESVLDPFAGTGTTGAVALSLGRKALLVDQNPQFAAETTARLAQLDPDGLSTQVRVGDVRSMHWIPTDSVDLIVTSPPYWNKADYGGDDRDLGAIASYRSFLTEMDAAFVECFRVLKPSRKICVVTANVNQHTDHGLLTFPLAADFVLSLRLAGFVMINELIWNKNGTGGRWGSWGAQRPIFGSYPYPPNFLFKNVHEYILVFAKPGEPKSKGPNMVPLAELLS